MSGILMARAEVESALVLAIEAESKLGIPWGPGEKIAPIAYRRWSTFARRHQMKQPSTEDRVLDLAKGLQAHFEPEIPYTPLSEWLHLARILAKVLAAQS
jgi:hypothetical protein